VAQLTISEIRGKARTFAREWRDETREAAERQSFWNDWFDVFGISRRRLVAFEHHVKKLSGKPGSIDVFWPGRILVEHKSRGEDLDKAMGQAEGYLAGLTEDEMPKLVVLSDFGRFRVRDLDTGAETEFDIDDLAEKVELFAFLAGYQRREFKDQHEVNVKAAELMGRIHDALDGSGYGGHRLRVLLVRLLFLLFADDSGVWETGLFEEFLEQRTREDGRDLGPLLAQLFEVLDTPEDERQATLDDGYRAFPYINGKLFDERIGMAAFDKATRERLIEASRFNWSAISPAIFGSMFQSVMNKDERRAIGAHYTTEANILKCIEPLFLDELRAELAGIGPTRARLVAFRIKLADMRVFDPACGCGNFLIVAYRELRRLELEVLKRLRALDRRQDQQTFDVTHLSRVEVDQFFGIEIEEFPARIAEVAMYLMDHLANQELSQEFGLYYARFPLKSAAQIHVDNALTLDWRTVLSPSSCTHMLGNPPFIAKKRRSADQQADMTRVFGGVPGTGELDYVAAWFERASQYVKGTPIRAAFVATNSLVQGEQVPALWPRVRGRGIAFDFAHRSFKWTSEARGKAAVYVVIIGFSDGGLRTPKLVFDYDTPTADPHVRRVRRLNAYLVDGPDVVIRPRRSPLVRSAPRMSFGSMPNDGGSLIVTAGDKPKVDVDPVAAKYLRVLLGAEELMHGGQRWCLWLVDADPTDLRKSPVLKTRIDGVFQHRSKSDRPATKQLAATPSLFGERRQPEGDYLCVPRHGSALRRYHPMVPANQAVIAHDSTLTIEGASDYVFGVLQSAMFMTWLLSVGGRIKGDPRISAEMVYNTFPWPDSPGPAARNRVETAAQAVLAARENHSGTTLDALYDPKSMPVDLLAAHRKVDAAVDNLYGRVTLDEPKRLARLLARYQQLEGGLQAPTRRAV
jgi:hypothetical protein